MGKESMRKKAAEVAQAARKKASEDGNTYIDRYVSCWNDLYSFFFREIETYLHNKNQQPAEATIALFSAFIHALRDLPDEGDAVVIGKRTMDIFVNHPERTGIDPFGFSEEEIAGATAVAEVLETLTAHANTSEEAPAEERSKLH